MKNLLLAGLSAAFLALLPSCTCSSEHQGAKEEEAPKFCPYGFDMDTLRVDSCRVQKNEFFANLLVKRGLPSSRVSSFIEATRKEFDPRSLRAGATYRCYYSLSDSTDLHYIVYDRNRVSKVIFDCRDTFAVWTYNRPVTKERRVCDVTIERSLYQDMVDQGVNPALVYDVADIYAWTVDFFGLKKGDRFHVVYDELFVEGEHYKIDTVRAVVFSSGGKDFPCVMFNQKDGGNIYWNEKGESMRKAFLKAPLKFTRISSGFSYARVHPVTRKVQPHTGVDYAAPLGTPVMTIGDGVVTSVKEEGAGGKTVRIKHNSVYSTAYLHLSKYGKDIRPGVRVHQGQVIGYVGSTGRSTGPHLDFRVWKNGSPVNPLTMQSPPATPINKENMAAFADSAAVYGISVPTANK